MGRFLGHMGPAAIRNDITSDYSMCASSDYRTDPGTANGSTSGTRHDRTTADCDNDPGTEADIESDRGGHGIEPKSGGATGLGSSPVTVCLGSHRRSGSRYDTRRHHDHDIDIYEYLYDYRIHDDSYRTRTYPLEPGVKDEN